MSDVILQLLPATVLGWIWLIPVYKICQKRGVSPWMWVGLTAIPLAGLFIVLPIFWVTTIMSILDRLNEKAAVFD